MLTLLSFQIYWLANIYQNKKIQYIDFIEESLAYSIDNELILQSGLFGEYDNVNRPKLIIKSADDMTPEEIKSHRGDTIVLGGDSLPHTRKGISSLFAQSSIEALLKERPFPMGTLDSLFNSEIQNSIPHARFLLNLCNQKGQILDSTHREYKKDQQVIIVTHPIGTKGELFIQAFVSIPPQQILLHLLYALIASFLMTIIIFYCLYYQLIVIRRTRKKLQQQEQTVHVAIHDLKAPLNTTYTILDYISQKETDNAQMSLLQTGKIQVRKLTETIESMLDAHKKKQNIEIKNVQVCLPELIEQVRQEVALLFPAKKYQFKLNNPIPIHYIYTDPVRLERCLRNLLENALKYSDDRVEITVTFSQKDNRLSIAIQDTGWGIPLKAQKKLGKQYYRVQTEGKNMRPGYGLGLCSVKQLLLEAGGTLTLHSSEGAGSVFTITFPVSEGE
ncbi:MAG: HAMP domain-containing histidine kinase [Parabacteroides sp.]|nr:HAMP domain-containing histidine kinase [Parabacteroides sp.]